MGKRGPEAAAKRKRENDKREKRAAKLERRQRRAEARAEVKETAAPEPKSEGDQ